MLNNIIICVFIVGFLYVAFMFGFVVRGCTIVNTVEKHGMLELNGTMYRIVEVKR